MVNVALPSLLTWSNEVDVLLRILGSIFGGLDRKVRCRRVSQRATFMSVSLPKIH